MGKTIQLHGFPSGQTAENIKEFLEKHTGEGSVFALKLRPAKSGGRFYAIIQFQSISQAEKIISLANARLWYGRSYLNARPAHDIVPKPRTFLHSLRDLVLHVGCQVAKDKFSVLWGTAEVSVDFGFGMRNLQFRLLYRQKVYRLQLSYENIWQIELHHQRGRSAKYLVIQLYGNPRIYQQEVCSSGGNGYEDMNYFRDPDDWVRTTDFTPGSCIGQSSSLCLVLTSDGELPDFEENFAYYKKTDGQFILENGSTFSRNRDLVPIVGSPAGIDLPYDILFKINLLVQQGCLSGPTLDNNFYRLVDPRRISRPCIEFALDKLSNLKESCYEPAVWLNEEYRKYMMSKKPPKPALISLDSGLVYVRRVQITPSKVYFSGPEVNVSNRILRQYSSDIDNFLRVSFVDEEMEKLYSTDLSPRTSTRKTRIYNRVLSVLRDGIVVGKKKFEFLAFSSSQLRENSLWMFAPTDEDSADTIRAGMGDFRQIRNVAKYAARLGQSFGSSTETLSVGRNEMEVIPDVTVNSCGIKYVFSDGIGKISADFAERVAKKCGYKAFTPSAFQIRYGGYKGVVAVDPTSSMKLSLRKSMSKYESENTKLDVLACSKYQPCFLNRQLITLLSTLEVQDHVFLKKQRAAVQQLNAILTDPLKAEEALDLMSAGESTNVLKELLMCGYKPNVEPFLSMMLQTFRASKLLELRTKTRIFIPDGRAMMGCLDETRTLEYGQVFVQFSGKRRRQLFDDICIHSSLDSCFIIEGKVVVAKNPCLHPGDVRVLRAVNVPDLHHMVDCVVFPQKGHRPHPNECSGSDLDGDIYFVCWDPELIPPKQIQPMDYTPAPPIEMDQDVTIEEVEEYFVNYIVNDSLGIIANAHTVFADSKLDKAMSHPCLQLAKLFSIAVDFPKTGVPAEIPPELYAKEYPDFMEKPDKRTYISHNVIGQLFREVKDIAPHDSSIASFTRQVATKCYDPDMEVDGFEDYLEDAFYHKGNYDYKLGNMLDYYGIKTEAEILSGSIMTLSKSFTKRRDADAINVAVKSLRKEARAWFNEKDTGIDSGDDDVYAKASAWYHVTYHPNYFGLYNEGMNRAHFISFPWCVFDKLGHIKKEKVNQARLISSLENRLRYGLRFS
ncbi:PREDICTED: RNA-dependent RNA polymerase 1 isoform X1 [Fragaria vesca subsp. vesca]|uniref:RNA-dependent RNA polymerase 1 isoform X1 n=1 Tax=Fragaria vesca subsp. vesca TaxID=101020 RepID=UPI0002C2F024|nr:PREDICTED: RNA-dependent RNA polymerase 1 isoform X1 [Fragaria vesca subsp. vesca]